MRVLAIDPGYERLGIAIIEKIVVKKRINKEVVIYSDCFITKKEIPHSERLGDIATELRRVIKEYAPDAVAVETLFFSKNIKTALPVAEARGVILSEAAGAHLPLREFSPMSIKIAVTGWGRSDKKQVIEMVKRLVAIQKSIRHDDEYDAIAIGLTFFASEKLSTPI